jgi:hypothetical protein
MSNHTVDKSSYQTLLTITTWFAAAVFTSITLRSTNARTGIPTRPLSDSNTPSKPSQQLKILLCMIVWVGVSTSKIQPTSSSKILLSSTQERSVLASQSLKMLSSRE